MPIHDWSKVDANVFHHFHQRWTVAICDALNDGLLPKGFSALIEQRAAGLVPDVLGLKKPSRKHRPLGPGGGVLTATPAHTRRILQTKGLLAARGNRVTVRHRLGEVVCIIEIVSPGNKSSKSALNAFTDKAVEFLSNGVNLLIADPLRPTKRDPLGVHKAIWDLLDEDESFELPFDKPLTLAAYVAGDAMADRATTAYVATVGVGDILPDMPAYLNTEAYVPVPLEATYATAWKHCPPAMRELVETGRLAGDDEDEAAEPD